MPELPEVEYVRRQLRPAMEGARIERVLARRPDLRYPLGADFVSRLAGQTVLALNRRAKYLVAELSSGDSLVMHLGMSGWFRVVKAPRKGAPYAAAPREGAPYYERSRLEAHDHVVFEMSNRAVVVFNDPRRFGFMKVLSPAEVASDKALNALGPEPLDRSFTADSLVHALKGKQKASLKTVLLDQRVVAGLGNIYVCEALHRARLSPKRKASTLVSGIGPSKRRGPTTRMGPTNGMGPALVDAIKTTLRDAIAESHRAGGDDRFLVYDREGRRCPRRSCTGTIRRIVQAGRSTFYCPICQR